MARRHNRSTDLGKSGPTKREPKLASLRPSKQRGRTERPYERRSCTSNVTTKAPNPTPLNLTPRQRRKSTINRMRARRPSRRQAPINLSPAPRARSLPACNYITAPWKRNNAPLRMMLTCMAALGGKPSGQLPPPQTLLLPVSLTHTHTTQPQLQLCTHCGGSLTPLPPPAAAAG